MDYTDYAGLDVKIITKDGHHCEGCVFGFMFENPESEVVLEIMVAHYFNLKVDDYTVSNIKVEEVESIEIYTP
jgi:hypothetical protein